MTADLETRAELFALRTLLIDFTSEVYGLAGVSAAQVRETAKERVASALATDTSEIPVEEADAIVQALARAIGELYESVAAIVEKRSQGQSGS